MVCQMPETDIRKKNVVTFYDLVFNQNEIHDAVERYVGDEFIQHNPNIETGKQGFITFYEQMAREHPRKRITVKRAFAEGNHVILHCLQEWPGEQHFASVDIFRLNDDGKIVEHWDVVQVMPQRSANPNGMF
jgi:predicted SnoaL-like aldol condensation-catalyzing enzyme